MLPTGSLLEEKRQTTSASKVFFDEEEEDQPPVESKSLATRIWERLPPARPSPAPKVAVLQNLKREEFNSSTNYHLEHR